MNAEQRTHRARVAWIGLPAIFVALLLMGPAPDARAGDVQFRISIGSGFHHKSYKHGFHSKYHHGKYHRYKVRSCSPFLYRGRYFHHHRYHPGLRLNAYGHSGYHSGVRYHYVVPLIRDPHVGRVNGSTYHTTARLHDPNNLYRRQYILRPGDAVRPGDPTAARVITRHAPRGVELTTYDTTTPSLADVRDAAASEQPGWSALLAGEASEAMKTFAIEAEPDPARGLPKVGFALAAALAGDHDRAYWAIRRALRYEPAALRRTPLDPALRERVYAWASEQADQAESQRNGGAAFMAAAYALVAGERADARRYIELAERYGHDTASTRALKRAVD